MAFFITKMNLYEQAKALIEQITSNSDEFGVELKFTAPSGETATIKGIHSKIHLAVSTDGLPVNSKQAHISFSEKFLTEQNYPVRNTNGEVNLKNHRINVKDSTGIEKKYQMQQWFPDETIGLISCMIEDYE